MDEWRSGLGPRLAQAVTGLTGGLVERETQARLAMLAALAGEHLLLIGPPGTAKSEIARRLREVFSGGSYFERLLTRFSVPEELFGPLSLKALENDEYRRLTAGYLPDASIAFLDEIFKANSAILNSLLGILNEREFDNGSQRRPVPLISVIAASNEIPTGEELHALYDRFLLRCSVAPVSESGFSALLQLEDRPPAIAQLSVEDLQRVRERSAQLPLSSGVKEALGALRQWLQSKQIFVSDRRWLKMARLLKVVAFTEGREVVLLSDLWVLPHCVWERPEQLPLVEEWLESRLRQLIAAEPERYARLIGSVGGFLEKQPKLVQKKDAAGKPLFLDEEGRPTTQAKGRRPLPEGLYYKPGERGRGYDTEELFRFFGDDLDAFDEYLSNPENQLCVEVDRQPLLEPRQEPVEHAAERLRQLDEVVTDLERFLGAISSQTGGGESLWSPRQRSLVQNLGRSSVSLNQSLAQLRQIRAALAAR